MKLIVAKYLFFGILKIGFLTDAVATEIDPIQQKSRAALPSIIMYLLEDEVPSGRLPTIVLPTGNEPQLEPVNANDSTRPPSPSIVRDLTGFKDREMQRPHIPPYRTSLDGRIAMQTRTRGTNPDANLFRFFLYAPEKLGDSFLASGNGMNILSDTDAFALPMRDFIRNPVADGDSAHSAICDPGGNPQTCGANGDNDCYRLKVLTPYRDENRDRTEMWGTWTNFEVENPKTENAQIRSITTEQPNRGAIWPGVNVTLESMATADGHMFVGRVGNSVLEWTDANGEQQSGPRNMMYSAYDPSLPACDENNFPRPQPISHAPYDPLVKENWGFARYPWRDPEGNIIPDGVNGNWTYPWVDSNGENIFFVWNDETLIDRNTRQSEFLLRCVPGTDCSTPIPSNTDDIEASDGTRTISVAGTWTQGRTVLIDNSMNNTDWGIRSPDAAHRLVRLYDDPVADKRWVRVGNGRDNNGDTRPEVAPGNSGNITFFDSVENKLNLHPSMKPAVGRDVAWFMSNGGATDVVAFDDWMQPHVLISSEMVQSSHLDNRNELVSRPKSVQNAAGTQRYRTPTHGSIIGPGRYEKVAMGGVRGKGVFLWPQSGIRYQIPGSQPTTLDNKSWFVSVLIDPRFNDDDAYRRLIEFPDGTSLDLLGLNSVSYRNVDGKRVNFQLYEPLKSGEYSHVGLRVDASNNEIDFYQDGMFVWRWNIVDDLDFFGMGPGSIVLGRGLQHTQGFTGWVDDFKVIEDPLQMTEEEICNHAVGSIVALNELSPPTLLAKANLYPQEFHKRISDRLGRTSGSKYLCFNENANQDGWVDLNTLPDNVMSVRDDVLFPEGPLRFNQPRQNSSNNPFCVSCHTDDESGVRPLSLMVQALTRTPGLPMQLDPRRQPLQALPRLRGNLPASYFGPNTNAAIKSNTGILVDEYLAN